MIERFQMPTVAKTRGPRRTLPRPRGAALASSNQRIVDNYGPLVRHVVGKRARAMRLSPEQTDDLFQSMMLALFNAPTSYRNYRGISLMLKHKMRRVIERTIKFEPEITVGLMRSSNELDKFTEPSIAPKNGNGVDFNIIVGQFGVLSSSERSVMSLLYGLEGFGDFSPALVAKKLGKDESWVHRKRESALCRLRSSLRISL